MHAPYVSLTDTVCKTRVKNSLFVQKSITPVVSQAGGCFYMFHIVSVFICKVRCKVQVLHKNCYSKVYQYVRELSLHINLKFANGINVLYILNESTGKTGFFFIANSFLIIRYAY